MSEKESDKRAEAKVAEKTKKTKESHLYFLVF